LAFQTELHEFRHSTNQPQPASKQASRNNIRRIIRAMMPAAPRWIDDEDTTTSSSRSQHHGVEITLRDAEHMQAITILPKHTTHPTSSSTAGVAAGGGGDYAPTFLPRQPDDAAVAAARGAGGGLLWTKTASWTQWMFSRTFQHFFATLKDDDDDKHNNDEGFQSEHLGDSRQYWRDIILGVNDGTFC
jgi:hypothetical protein